MKTRPAPTLEAVWRQAGTTRRSHLVMRRAHPQGFVVAGRSICGMVRLAAWGPETRGCRRCRSCERFKKYWRVIDG